MATDIHFVQHVLDQAGLNDRLVSSRMFGEFGFHLDGKFVAMACDNIFFVKATDALEKLALHLPMRSPYPGAKPYPVADALLDEPERLHQFLVDTAAHLPTPKPKKTKTPKNR